MEQQITIVEHFNTTTNFEDIQMLFPAPMKPTHQANHHFGRYLKPSSNTNHTITSCDAPEKRLDWGFIVDNVFKEEIGKMAEEFKNGK